MSKQSASKNSGRAKDPLIVALDVDSLDRALQLVQQLADKVSFFKIGLQLFTREGPRVVEQVRKNGGEVFLDLKFHDIPNTVARACESAAALRVKMLTLHASGGREMMMAAVAAVRNRDIHLLGVTVLTSEKGTSGTESRVVTLAREVKEAGLGGVVCSGHEIQTVREACGDDFLIVVPGVRLAGEKVGDQKRVVTPREAVAAGADYLVVGRPLLESPDPLKTVRLFLEEMKF